MSLLTEACSAVLEEGGGVTADWGMFCCAGGGGGCHC